MSSHERSSHQPERDRFEIDINALRHLPLAEAQAWIAKYFVDFLATKVFPWKYRILQVHDFHDCGQEVLCTFLRKRNILKFLMTSDTLDAFVGDDGGFRGLKAWLYETFNHFCLKYIDHKKRMVLVPPDSLEQATLVTDPLVERELRDALDKFIRELDKKAEFVMTEHYFFGRALTELAKKCNVPIGTVKSWLFRSRREIREKLIARFGDDFQYEEFRFADSE